jgi:hypothetical protein
MAAYKRVMRLGSGNRRAVSLARVDRVTEEVAREFEVSIDDLRGTRKTTRRISGARKEAWRRLATPGIAIASIGRAWPCDPTSIHHALGPAAAEE